MYRTTLEQRWFWATLMLSCISIAVVVFAVWELAENRFFRHVDFVTLHYLYITRGIASSLLLSVWAAWYVVRQRRRSEEELLKSRERYRGLLEVSPGAAALFDSSLNILEWNASAERLYGFTKEEVLGKPLPNVPAQKREELLGFLEKVEAGEAQLRIETLRHDKQGLTFEVQLSLLPFRETAGQTYFLEVTEDIRERVRLRERLLEIEKLTTMGRMAAGTAHHLNTPLAAVLLRIQMMRERVPDGSFAADLERLESGIGCCHKFVDRLLQFSRRPAARKQPEEVVPLIQGTLNFLAPAMLAKEAQVSVEADSSAGERILADRNLVEALLSVLVSNALDGIGPGGSITVRCSSQSLEYVQIEVSDDGCGIAAEDLSRVFEPFFTTKGPGKGTGLGLSIARNIVIEHEGTIHLESAPGRGTTAFVRLPRYQTALAQMEAGS